MRPSAPLQTQVDAELAPVAPRLMESYARLERSRAAATPVGVLLEQPAAASGMTLESLQSRHGEHGGQFWDNCQLLYEGGQRLLGDKEALARLFPSHRNELPDIYEERRKRAFYLAYPTKIVNALTSGVGSDPLRMVVVQEGAKIEDKIPEVPKEWAAWAAQVTRPGASLQNTHSLHTMVCEAIRMAQIKRSAWILTDMPRLDLGPGEAPTLLDQERSGLRPYHCLVDASEILDWWEDDDGTLRWVMHYTSCRPRRDPRQPRRLIEHTWTLWTDTEWVRYVYVEDPSKQAPPPQTVIAVDDQGTHPFGCVPWIRFEVPAGLWTMGLLESPAREFFNKRNALAWAEYKSLFAVLYEFLAPPPPAAVTIGAAGDPNRATNQTRGQGWTQRRGEKDRAEYIGPDTSPFSEARTSCSELMQEMFRVTNTMAASADMKAAALQRSADSKSADSKETKVVLEAFGKLGRDLAVAMREMAARGAVSTIPDNLKITGMMTFDTESVQAMIADAAALYTGVPVLSPTFKRLHLATIYQAILGDAATPKTVEEMRNELREAIESEGVLLGQGPGVMGGQREPKDDEGAAPPAKPKKA
jgi:hypothetical protein